MRKTLCLAAAMLAACGADVGDAPVATTASEQTQISAGTLPMPAVATDPQGHWVHDELTDCANHEEWLVLRPDGGFVHVLANRSRCGESTLERHEGRWTSDHEIVTLAARGSNGRTKRELTYATVDGELRLGAYIAVDGGWHKRDASAESTTDTTLRIENLELRDGAACRLHAIVTDRTWGQPEVTHIDEACVVSRRGDRWVVATTAADLPWELETISGKAFWHADAATYRFTTDAPPNAVADLEE